jgi:hypothetical protein
MQLPAILKMLSDQISGLLSGTNTRQSAAVPEAAVVEWKKIEYFDERWQERIKRLAEFVPPGSSVMDLGCGKMWLRNFLVDCDYIPVDYCPRGKDTVVCDFNKGEFPEQSVDVAFVSGCLEYIDHPQWFVDQIESHAQRCVISYCTTDAFPDFVMRSATGWKNHFDRAEIISMFEAKSLRLIGLDFLPDSGNTLFCFQK